MSSSNPARGSSTGQVLHLRPVELPPPDQGGDGSGGGPGGPEGGEPVELLVLIDPKAPLAIARIMIRQLHCHNQMRTLHYWRGDFWRWNGGAWLPLDEQEVVNVIYKFIDTCRKRARDGSLVECPPNQRFVVNVLHALKSAASLKKTIDAPCWLDPKDNQIDE